MKVAVIGAGIMGAASAFHLAQAGVDVHLFDHAPGPAQGVTRDAFGWINTLNGDPRHRQAYDLRIRAVQEYASVLSAMPELAPHVHRGSLVWKGTPEETASFAAQHRDAGHLELISCEAISQLESRLKDRPELAIHAPGDLAISPAALTVAFLARATPHGAVLHYGDRVLQLHRAGDVVAGIGTTAGVLRFDLVVLAAGVQTRALAASAGVSVDVQASPVILLRYRTGDRLLSNIVSSPTLEIRQAPDGSVLLVEDFFPGCDAENFSALRQRADKALQQHLALPSTFTFQGAAIGQRPMLPDGLPLHGFARDVRGLYLLVGHPGVILAPLLGRLAAQEIMARFA